MTVYLGNAFSLNMVEAAPHGVQVDILPVRPEEIPVSAVSIIGHEDTAKIVSGMLKRPVDVNRVKVTLEEGDVLYVAQYHGERLPAGTEVLPAASTLEFYCVKLRSLQR